MVLTLLVVICGAEWQDGNDGVDRRNGDLLSVPISLKAGATPRDCAQMCYANTQCKAWTFSKPNCSGSAVTAQCYFKAEVTQQSRDLCKVSCTVEPLYNGQVGAGVFVRYSEVSFIGRVGVAYC